MNRALSISSHVQPDSDLLLEQSQHRERLAVAREQRLVYALEAGSAGVWDWNIATGEVWLSDLWQTMLGYEPGELPGELGTWERLVHPEDKPHASRCIEEHMHGRTTSYECEHRLRCKDGAWGWVLARGRIMEYAPDGRPLRMVGTHIDIRARKQAESQIAYMAQHDALTDLPNRTLFREQLEGRLAALERGGLDCVVLCLDLDRFKSVNDTYGHLAGDALLRELSARMRSLLGPDDVLARLGGDEFGILLSAGPTSAQVEALARHLIDRVGMPVELGEYQAEVGLSIGMARAPEHGRDTETLFRRADLALYRAKVEGRNAWRLFDEAMDKA